MDQKVLVVGIEIADVERQGQRPDRLPDGFELQALVDLLAGIEPRGEIGRRALVSDEILQLDLRIVVGIVEHRQIEDQRIVEQRRLDAQLVAVGGFGVVAVLRPGRALRCRAYRTRRS